MPLHAAVVGLAVGTIMAGAHESQPDGVHVVDPLGGLMSASPIMAAVSAPVHWPCAQNAQSFTFGI